MPNPNLIPTLITDRNGKLTTVHKRPQALSQAALLPSPALQPVKDRKHLEKGVYEGLLAVFTKMHEVTEQGRTDLSNDLRGYSESTLHSLSLIFTQDDDLARGVALHMMQGESEALVNETIFFYRLTDSHDYWKTAAEVRALGQYAPVSFYNDLSKEDEYVTDICLALMKVSRLIDTVPDNPSPHLEYTPTGNLWDMAVIKDEELVNFIATRPEDADEIAEIIRDYDTTNPAAINGIMQGNTPSLAEGTL